jgi:hypothetical protein
LLDPKRRVKNNARTWRALFLTKVTKDYFAAGVFFAFLDFFAFLAMMFFQKIKLKKAIRKYFLTAF